MLQNDNIDQKMVDDTALMQKTLDFLVENAKITVSTEENNAALNTEAAEDERSRKRLIKIQIRG